MRVCLEEHLDARDVTGEDGKEERRAAVCIDGVRRRAVRQMLSQRLGVVDLARKEQERLQCVALVAAVAVRRER